MNDIGTQKIETERLCLRRFCMDDVEQMYGHWANDGAVTRYLTWLPHQNTAQTAEILQGFVAGYQNPRQYLWGIEKKDTKELMGSVGLFDRGQETLDFGYCIGQAYWNMGYMTEAGKAILSYAFTQIGVNRVEGYHATDNMASGRVLSKIGLKREGFVRQKYFTGAHIPQDSYTYGLAAAEYFGNLNIGFAELLQRAQEITGNRVLSQSAVCGSVGAALLTENNNIYTGICMDVSCSVGFCAEHSAAAAMLAAGEHRIKKLVAVNSHGDILPPCGRCRELLSQLCDDNTQAEVMVAKDTVRTLGELLPYDWRAGKKAQRGMSLYSQRLALVPLCGQYIADIFANFDSQVTTYMLPVPPKEIAESAAFVRGAMERSAAGRELEYAITNRETGEFLGCCGIHNIKSGMPELGIWTKTAAHGHGYGFEAISRLILHVREHIPYDYMVYPVDKRNKSSRRIPILHGGTVKKEYTVDKSDGTRLQIEEYHIG